MKKNGFLAFIVVGILCLHTQLSYGATVDTIVTYSAKMKKSIKAVVVKPNNYSSLQNRYPVVYVLHGYSGNYASWVKGAKNFAALADIYGMVLVCPDGGFSSWYWDSPIDENYQYETYLSKELVSFIDSSYHTIRQKTGRAITGLSMGGHGAMYLAIKHPDVFGAAGTMSGGVDIRPFPFSWEMAKRLGSYAEYPERWEQNTVVNLLHRIAPNSQSFIIDCGTEDFFYKVNVQLHEQMLYRNIPHDFISRPGAHNMVYWSNAVLYQALFFHQFFTKESK